MTQEGGSCPICLEKIGKNNVITTVCGHTFHASCIIQNLHVSKTCPLCRHIIDPSPKQTMSERERRDSDYADIIAGVDYIELDELRVWSYSTIGAPPPARI